MNKLEPSIGVWYKDIQQKITFEVVAVDDTELSIETQLIDGEVGGYDFDSWKELILIEVEEPEDWRNVFELGDEDYLDSNDTMHPEDWTNPLNVIESDIVNGILDEL
jgi:hypothetical protein